MMPISISKAGPLVPIALLLCSTACSDNKTTETPTASCPAKIVMAGGTLSGAGVDHSASDTDEVWKAADSPHRLKSDQGSGPGGNSTLTIEPCAVVIAGKNSSLQVGSPSGDPGSKGELIAVGSADKPILITGEQHQTDWWNGVIFSDDTTTSHLSYVTIEDAGNVSNSAALEIVQTTGGGKPFPVIEHVTVQNGAYDGIVVRGNSGFGPGSGNNTVTKMSGVPLRVDACVSNKIPDGTYTGNAVDLVAIQGESSNVPAECGDIDWPKLSVPYLYDLGIGQGWYTKLTIEPGVDVQMKRAAEPTNGGVMAFSNGGSLIADGKSDATRIVLEGYQNTPWDGLSFLDKGPSASAPAGASTLNYVTIKNAGTQTSCGNGELGNLCSNGASCTAVIIVEGKFLTMTNTEIVASDANVYGVARDYCGDGTAEFSASSTGNKFTGQLMCAESDQFDCAPSCDKTCCLHDYKCQSQ